MRHRQTILSVLVLVLIVGTAGQLHAADCNFRYGDGNWSNAALWENGVPDASKSALMRRVATLDEDANCSSLEFGLTYGTEIGAVVVSANNTLTVGGAANLIGYQAYITQSDGTIAFGGELNMSTREFDTSIDVSGGQLTASAMSLGRQATGKVSVATLTQSGGAVSVARTYIARNTGSDGSKFSFSGGAFSGSSDFYLGSATNDGTLEIVGNAAGSSFNVTKFATSSTDNESTVRFKLASNGATTVTCSSWWNLRSGITLDVDTLAGFSANLGDTFDVITSTASSGADASTLVNSSAAGYTFSKALVDADSDTVFETLRLTVTDVPEPATMVLLAVGGVGVLLRRRRRI